MAWRYTPDLYPQWVPSCDYYRPDGYWYISGEEHPKIITIEVELTQKTYTRYNKVSDFFKLYPKDQNGNIFCTRKPAISGSDSIYKKNIRAASERCESLSNNRSGRNHVKRALEESAEQYSDYTAPVENACDKFIFNCQGLLSFGSNGDIIYTPRNHEITQ